MKFQVMSRQNARQYSFNPDIEKCIIVSINDKADEANQFAINPQIIRTRSFFFDDVGNGFCFFSYGKSVKKTYCRSFGRNSRN